MGASSTCNDEARRSALGTQIENQGAAIRKMKNEKASKGDVDAQVKALLELKAEYKRAVGEDWKPAEARNDDKKKRKNGPKETPPTPPPPPMASKKKTYRRRKRLRNN